MKTAVVLIGHGSRRPAGNQRVAEIAEALQGRLPEVSVSHGFIELAEPHMTVALASAAQHAERVVVVPVLLFASGHAQVDIPEAVAEARAAYPQVDFVQTEVLAHDPRFLDILDDRVSGLECMENRAAVVLVGRGWETDGMRGQFLAIVDQFKNRHDFERCEVAYAGVCEPSIGPVLDELLADGPVEILVVPFLFFPSILTERLQEAIDERQDVNPGTRLSLADTLFDGRVVDMLAERCS